MKLELAISPCPNDTYIFYELAKSGFAGHQIALEFADVEELNQRAIQEARHPITKLSCFAMHAAADRYQLLSAGGALGRGCGPLLLGREMIAPAELQKRPGQLRVLVPGMWTTAAFLVRSFFDSIGFERHRLDFVPMRYDRIMPLLVSGQEELGVIIHEERFSYKQRGLFSIQDLGEFWEEETGYPIPLGCIALRRDLPGNMAQELTASIRKSIAKISLADPEAMSFIRQHSQSLEDDVIRAHIDLYVNDYSVDMGAEGQAAMEELFRRAEAFAG